MDCIKNASLQCVNGPTVARPVNDLVLANNLCTNCTHYIGNSFGAVFHLCYPSKAEIVLSSSQACMAFPLPWTMDVDVVRIVSSHAHCMLL